MITGITGQDGSYLAEFLLERGYEIWGVVRRTSTPSDHRIHHLLNVIHIVHGDVADQSFVTRIVSDVRPHEIYNLAAQAFVPTSWDIPLSTFQVNALGPLHFLEALRRTRVEARFYQASSSEMFGKVREIPQTERTSFYPRSPYGVSKAAGHWATVNYRESFGLFACSGILFNHESPRRGLEFVTKKVCRSAASIKLNGQRELRLGNLDAQRDWGYAPEYVRAMWEMLQRDTPDDYVIATGEAHSVRELVEIAFECVGLNWQDYVVSDQSLIRPAEVDVLIGDASKARRVLNWKPSVTFANLVPLMVDAELALQSAGGRKFAFEKARSGIGSEL